MKNRRIAVSLCLLFLTFVLTSCHRVAGNQLDFGYLPFDIDEYGIAKIEIGDSPLYIDVQNGQYERGNGEYVQRADNLVVEGGTAPRYELSAKEGYEGILDDLLGLQIDDEKSVIYTQGYLIDGVVLGICNVYYDTVGYLSGGGNYGEEEIAYSVYYRYDNQSDTFTVLEKVNGAMMVAFSGDTVLYWKKENMYAYAVNSDEERFLCKDYSYDSGLQHQSHGLISFNEKYALFLFRKAKGNKDTYYLFLYGFEEGSLLKLTEKK